MASKKRVHVCNGEDEEQEDEKMEQFFALIRNFHEAVNRRKNELRQRDEKIRRVDEPTRKNYLISVVWIFNTQHIGTCEKQKGEIKQWTSMTKTLVSQSEP
ncbi:hypothetical protein GOBAR_DD31535 [Gossypium barbadense]|nr:hypothetical protein GOBAR_DD31535 [Gossypium barbadense]